MSVVHAPAEPTHALVCTTVTYGNPEPRGTGDTSLWRVALAPGTPSTQIRPAGARSGVGGECRGRAAAMTAPGTVVVDRVDEVLGSHANRARPLSKRLLSSACRGRIGHNRGTERSPSSVRTNRLQSFPL